jgi:membrane protease YdiL (CAAX protease family)
MMNRRPIVVSLLLTLVALAESTVAPWAPLIVLYAILCIIIPVGFGSCYFGSFKKAFTAHWRLLFICLILLILWDLIFTSRFFPLRAALPVFIERSAFKLHANAVSAKIVFGFFILIWAPVGEEFLYRGYLQGNLRKKMSFTKALLIAASFFAVRHGFHLLFLYPGISWPASLTWIILAFGWGIVLGWLYEKSSSLYLPITAHFLANCFSLIFS